MSTAAAVTGARNTELGCRQGQRHWRLSRVGRELRQWQSVVTGKLREMVAAEAGISGESGDSGLRWEGECEVTK